MSCRMTIEQLKDSVCGCKSQLKSGESPSRPPAGSAHSQRHRLPPLTPPPPPAADSELLLRSQEERQRLQRRAGRHQEKLDRIERHKRRLGDLLERRERDLQNRLEELAGLRREHIAELTTHIFPMKEEKQGNR